MNFKIQTWKLLSNLLGIYYVLMKLILIVGSKEKVLIFHPQFFTSKFHRDFAINLRKARIEEPIDAATYYKVNLKGEIAEEKNDLDCVTSYKLFRLGF